MKKSFSETVALKIMNDKLRGKPREAVYELTDAELAVLRESLEYWTVGMSQILANAVGDMTESETIIKGLFKLPEPERVKLAEAASATLDRGDIPSHREFAAYILSNHSDQLHIADEIARRESLQ